jgi:predicted DNA-binding WGR domain protein
MQTTIRKRDPAKHMARFYSLRAQGVLRLTQDGQPDAPLDVAGVALLREWGRIGSPGKVRLDSVKSLDEAEIKAARIAALKRRKGYR